MAVALLNSYSSHNVGDWLLCANSEAVVRRLHPGEPIIAYAMDPTSFYGRLGADVSVFPSPTDRTRPAISFGLAVVALLTGARVGPKHLRAMRKVKAAYSVGGGFLQIRSMREFLAITLVHITQLALCRRLKIPLVMLPQSVGPFYGGFARAYARRFLRWFDVIMVREQRSFTHIQELDRRLARRAQVAPDLAFWQAEPRPRRKPQSAKRPNKVGIVVRQWWFPQASDPGAAEQAYLQGIAELIETLDGSGMDPRLVIHSDGPTQRGDDRISTRATMEKLSSPVPVESVATLPSLSAVLEHYAAFDVIVSSRLHASLLSLIAGVPAIALGYEWKSEGIYDELGLSDWHCAIDNWDVAGVKDLIAEHQRFPWSSVHRRMSDLNSQLVTAVESLHPRTAKG